LLAHKLCLWSGTVVSRVPSHFNFGDVILPQFKQGMQMNSLSKPKQDSPNEQSCPCPHNLLDQVVAAFPIIRWELLVQYVVVVANSDHGGDANPKAGNVCPDLGLSTNIDRSHPQCVHRCDDQKYFIGYNRKFGPQPKSHRPAGGSVGNLEYIRPAFFSSSCSGSQGHQRLDRIGE